MEQQCRPELGNECVNTPGSFVCRCQPGFRAEASACVGEPGSPSPLSEPPVSTGSCVLLLVSQPCSFPLLSGPVCPRFTVCQGMSGLLLRSCCRSLLDREVSLCPSLVPQMWTSVWRTLRCVALLRACVKTRWGATSVFARQVTKETAHTAKVVCERRCLVFENGAPCGGCEQSVGL